MPYKIAETMPERVRYQAHKIEDDCNRASVRDSLVSADWDRANRYLGIFAALLAATAASTAFQDDAVFDWITSVAAVLSAVLGSILTFLSPSQKAATFQQTSAAYGAMRDRLRAFQCLECVAGADGEKLKTTYEVYLMEKRKIDADHPIVPQSYYKKARIIIGRREQEAEEKEQKAREKDARRKADDEARAKAQLLAAGTTPQKT
jgi:hypothetical protein